MEELNASHIILNPEALIQFSQTSKFYTLKNGRYLFQSVTFKIFLITLCLVIDTYIAFQVSKG